MSAEDYKIAIEGGKTIERLLIKCHPAARYILGIIQKLKHVQKIYAKQTGLQFPTSLSKDIRIIASIRNKIAHDPNCCKIPNKIYFSDTLNPCIDSLYHISAKLNGNNRKKSLTFWNGALRTDEDMHVFSKSYAKLIRTLPNIETTFKETTEIVSNMFRQFSTSTDIVGTILYVVIDFGIHNSEYVHIYAQLCHHIYVHLLKSGMKGVDDVSATFRAVLNEDIGLFRDLNLSKITEANKNGDMLCGWYLLIGELYHTELIETDYLLPFLGRLVVHIKNDTLNPIELDAVYQLFVRCEKKILKVFPDVRRKSRK